MKRLSLSHIITPVILAVALTGCIDRTEPPAPVVNLGANIDSPGGGIIVARNDTLYNISLRYGLTIRDLIEMNGDISAKNLNPGQRIALPVAETYRVRSGDTLNRLARMFGMRQSELASINNLKSPYHLKAGQVLNTRRPDKTEIVYAPKPKVEAEPMVASRPAAVEQAVLAPPSKPVPKQSQTAQATPAKWHPPQPQPPSSAKDRSQPYASKGFDWPVRGRILSNYGAKESGLHNDGVNIQGALGAPVMAADAGQVMYVGNALKGFGNLILVKHDNGWVSAYGHLNDTRVARGDYLDRGDIIGSIGQSGRVDSPQLHFEIRKGAEAIDPEQKLPKI